MNAANDRKNALKISGYRGFYIASGILFAVILFLCLTAFNFVSYEASGTVFNFARMTAYIAALVVSVLICGGCARAAGYERSGVKKDTFYYMKRMGFTVIMTVLMSLAASLIGMFANAFFGGMLTENISNPFLRGFILKLPVFILYLSFIYKMLIRQGFMDCEHKIFNSDFKMLTFIIAFIVMLPDAVHDSMFDTGLINSLIINVHSVLSPNVDIYVIESDGYYYFNEKFNIIFVLITVVLTFAVQAVFARFAYGRGKRIFIQEHIRKADEYDTDEDI